jgi:predicted AAA+ superfamily ATPase
MYIKRSTETVFLELSEQYAAVLITGPRQVGKTTMLQKLREAGRKYVSLDDLNDRNLAKTDPKMFLQIHKPPVFIDEVQYAPELFPYIKIHIDQNFHPGDFWLSGSPIFKLMEGVQESLAGRIAVIHMPPLSAQEIRASDNFVPFTVDFDMLSKMQQETAPKTAIDIFKQIFRGGMPALISGKYKNSAVFYASYISTYLERDVRGLSGTIDSLKFMNFITATAARTSQMVNMKALADECNLDQSTAKNWLRILEALGIIFYLHPYANNTLKRTVKTPKIYFYDTGLVCYLTKWSNFETAMNGAMSGALLENYVVAEILKSHQNTGNEAHLYYYRDKDLREIDLIMETDGNLHPLEIKKTASPSRNIPRTFSIVERTSLSRGMGAVLCMAERLSAFDSQNLIVPVYLV